MDVAVVVPSWNGRRWLPGLFASLRAQTVAPAEVVVVDNGSTDGTLDWLAAEAPEARVVELGRNTGFAVAANRGIHDAQAEAVALVNTDVELEPRWIELMAGALDGHAAVACKMVRLGDPGVIDDAGDILRRDGVCEQRGRGHADDGRWDAPGEVFSACAGAALYRRDAVLAAGGFDERFFSYLEDVDLGLRLRLAGETCWYEPRAVARHAGGGSSDALDRPVPALVERNTLLIAARTFPWSWAPSVLYRQAAWAWHALRRGEGLAFARGAASALPLLPAMWRERGPTAVPIQEVVPKRPFRGPEAGGHPRGSH